MATESSVTCHSNGRMTGYATTDEGSCVTAWREPRCPSLNKASAVWRGNDRLPESELKRRKLVDWAQRIAGFKP